MVLPADYVARHVELAYASSAHRCQGRTVDTAHAMVSATTTKEVLYVSATRGRESNRLYVDTHNDPEPETSHDGQTEPTTARQVLAGVLRHEGADVAAHEMIRRAADEAESMERLSAEYLTLAVIAQASHFDAMLASSGLSDAELQAVRASDAQGPLLAAFRDAEARGFDLETALPLLVSGRSLTGVDDVPAVLHHRVERWTDAGGGRHQRPGTLIAGLIPRAKGVTAPSVDLDCRFQTICEGCGFFETGPQFVEILSRQRDDATAHLDRARAKLYDDLVNTIDAAPTDPGQSTPGLVG